MNKRVEVTKIQELLKKIFQQKSVSIVMWIGRGENRRATRKNEGLSVGREQFPYLNEGVVSFYSR